MAGCSFHRMFTDFDMGFDIMSSPVSAPRSSNDFSVSIGSRDFDFGEMSMPFGFDDRESICCSQPLDPMPEITRPTFEIQISAPVPRIPTPKVQKRKSTSLVFKPFVSFESTELTVRGLRQAMASRPKDLSRTHSMPLVECLKSYI